LVYSIISLILIVGVYLIFSGIDIILKKEHTTRKTKRKGEIIMDLSTIIFMVGLLGAIFGVKKPLIGGIAGLLIAPVLFDGSITGLLMI